MPETLNRDSIKLLQSSWIWIVLIHSLQCLFPSSLFTSHGIKWDMSLIISCPGTLGLFPPSKGYAGRSNPDLVGNKDVHENLLSAAEMSLDMCFLPKELCPIWSQLVPYWGQEIMWRHTSYKGMLWCSIGTILLGFCEQTCSKECLCVHWSYIRGNCCNCRKFQFSVHWIWRGGRRVLLPLSIHWAELCLHTKIISIHIFSKTVVSIDDAYIYGKMGYWNDCN